MCVCVCVCACVRVCVRACMHTCLMHLRMCLMHMADAALISKNILIMTVVISFPYVSYLFAEHTKVYWRRDFTEADQLCIATHV